MKEDLIEFFNKKVDQFNQPSFIKDDPVFVPHQFNKKQDIEISGFFAATFAWGVRTTIINKSMELMKLMDNAPHQFIIQHEEKDLKKFLHFKHRTFNTTDLLYFISFLKFHYSRHSSLEKAFFPSSNKKDLNAVEKGLNHFYSYFFSLEDAPPRTKKHVAAPQRKSSCKRLNMFLRWMVRNDEHGVDFGIWKSIQPSQLICPVDLHVARVAKRFGLLDRKLVDWQAAVELTEHLRKLDKNDPAKYDFALFGLGILEKY
ncbi:MAG: TIGR02757 family protein [Flavitalea sp.]